MREIINKVTYLPKKKNKHSMYRSSVKRAENRMCWWLRDKGQLQGLCSHRVITVVLFHIILSLRHAFLYSLSLPKSRDKTSSVSLKLKDEVHRELTGHRENWFGRLLCRSVCSPFHRGMWNIKVPEGIVPVRVTVTSISAGATKTNICKMFSQMFYPD